jgi:hypothetical protein
MLEPWRRTLGLRWMFGLCLCLWLGTEMASVHAQTEEPGNVMERQVKAAYLFKFGSFVEWPAKAFADAATPIQIGVLNADALADDLTQIVAGRSLHGRPIAVRKLRSTDRFTGLHVLFMGRVNKAQLRTIVASTSGQPTLLVTELEEALELGSLINFVTADEKVRFEVAPRNGDARGLVISARLLAAALKVETRAP